MLQVEHIGMDWMLRLLGVILVWPRRRDEFYEQLNESTDLKVYLKTLDSLITKQFEKQQVLIFQLQNFY